MLLHSFGVDAKGTVLRTPGFSRVSNVEIWRFLTLFVFGKFLQYLTFSSGFCFIILFDRISV